jgi:hypothetical protein
MRVHQHRRAERVRELGEPTLFDLATAVFPNLASFGVMLGVSEAVGHLDSWTTASSWSTAPAPTATAPCDDVQRRWASAEWKTAATSSR